MIEHNNLEAYSDAVNYDKEDASDTGVAFYSALAQEAGGSVLELACGTGRVAIPIAKLGFPVTGLDIVPGMLAQAQSKSIGLPIRWIEGDARTFDLGEAFHLIFLTGNAFQAFLTNADQAALLRRVHVHLHDQGLFAFETRNPRWTSSETRAEAYEGAFFLLETRAEEHGWQTVLDAQEQPVQTSLTQVYDHTAQIVHVTSYKRWYERAEPRTHITRIALRYTFPQELAALLQYAGFAIIRQYGDWNYEPLTAASPSIIVVCRKQSRHESNRSGVYTP